MATLAIAEAATSGRRVDLRERYAALGQGGSKGRQEF